MKQPLATHIAHEFLGDSADCLRDSMETLCLLSKELPVQFRTETTVIVAEINALRLRIEKMKGEVHRHTYAQQPDVFSAFVCVPQSRTSRYSQPS